MLVIDNILSFFDPCTTVFILSIIKGKLLLLFERSTDKGKWREAVKVQREL